MSEPSELAKKCAKELNGVLRPASNADEISIGIIDRYLQQAREEVVDELEKEDPWNNHKELIARIRAAKGKQ